MGIRDEEKKLIMKMHVIDHMYATAVQNGKDTNYDKIVAVANRLHRLETTLQRLAVDESCFPTYDAAKQERLEKLAGKIITEEIGCDYFTQRDPRGYCIRMYLTDQFGREWCNTWDGKITGLAW